MALGFDAISGSAISGESAPAGTPSQVTAFVSNANAPQIDAVLIAGFAALFAVSLASSNAAQAAEYQFGTHAVAIYESQFKGAIWGPASSPPTSKALGTFVCAPEQAYTNAPSWVLASVRGATPQPIALIVGQPQTDPTQVPASIFAPLSGATPRPIALTTGAPQSVDLTIQGSVLAPLDSPQGRLTAQFSVGPQADPTQPPALISTPQAAPQGRVPPLTVGAPQLVDLTLQG
jgi:hypothetical protein